jgi:hypothetical protein
MHHPHGTTERAGAGDDEHGNCDGAAVRRFGGMCHRDDGDAVDLNQIGSDRIKGRPLARLGAQAEWRRAERSQRA